MGRFFQKGIISIWNHLQQHCLLQWSPDWPGDCLGPPLEVNKYFQRLIGMKLLETVDWWGSERSALLLQHRYLSLEQGTSGTNYGTVHVLCCLHGERLSTASRVWGMFAAGHYESISLARLPATLTLLTRCLSPFLKNLPCEEQNMLHLLRLKLCLRCLCSLRHEGSYSPLAAGTEIGFTCRKKFSPTLTLAHSSSNNTVCLPFSTWHIGLDQNPSGREPEVSPCLVWGQLHLQWFSHGTRKCINCRLSYL